MSVEVGKERPNLGVSWLDEKTGKRKRGEVIDLPENICLDNVETENVVCQVPDCKCTVPTKWAKRVEVEDSKGKLREQWVCPRCLFMFMTIKETNLLAELEKALTSVENLQKQINRINNSKLIIPGRI